MALDTEILSRLQFAFTLSYHILFPTLTIGLSVFLVIFEALWLKTGDARWLRHCKFWAKIFALTFGMGVVTGIVLSYEFGTNFAPFSRATGNILGPLLTYEVLSAFFLEAGFLGVMLFGWNRVGPRMHFAATVLVMLGTMASAFWILAANSWMQTPAGYTLENGIFSPANWWAVVFNPSFPYRLAHMLLASLLTASVFVAGVSAWFLRRGRNGDWAARSLAWGIGIAALAAPAQVLVGDLHGLNVLEHQPVKVAAMEANWETRSHVPLLLFAWPDMQAETNRYEIAIPNGASLILKHEASGVVPGLKSVPPEDRPNVPLVFWSFRVMVGIGFALLALAWWGTWLVWRRRHTEAPRFWRLCILASPLGFVATVAGWWVAEVGRQPWVVQGLMRTEQAVTPLPAGQVLSSLLAFVGVYTVLSVAYLYYLLKVIRKGPEAPPETRPRGEHAPARPAFLEGLEE